MELVYKQVSEWQNKLFDAVDSMKNLKIQRLQQQLDQLKSYRAEINEGKKKYQELIDDPSLDVQFRKKQVVEMVEKLLGRSEIPLLMVTQPKVEFGWDDQYLNTLLSHIVINDCDQPFPPYIFVTAIRASSIVLQVTVITGESGREVLEFAIEYAVLPKDEDSKLKLESPPVGDPSAIRNPSVASDQPSLKSGASQSNVAAGKSKGKKKKKGDDSSSEESKSDKSSAEEEEDEDKSSESGSEEEESSESGSEKDSDKSSGKSSGDSDDGSDSSGGKKKKGKKGKKEKKDKGDKEPKARGSRVEMEKEKEKDEKVRARAKSRSRSASGSLSAGKNAAELQVAPPSEEAAANEKDESDDEKAGDGKEGPNAEKKTQ